MRESVTYQAILKEGKAEGRAEGRVEGKVEEARTLLLKLGTIRFGPADEATQDAIQAIASTEALERLVERLLTVETWQELLS